MNIIMRTSAVTVATTTPPREPPTAEDDTQNRRRSSTSAPRPTRGSFRSSSNNNNNNNNQPRRRSSASEITLEQFNEKTSIFCPLPKKGFFYSKAYKEHKKKRKQLKQQRALETGSNDIDLSSVDDEIPIKRDLTRRKRNSFVKKSSFSKEQPTNVTAYLAARVEAEKPVVTIEERYSHSAMMLSGLSKSHMLDVTLVGSDQKPVMASKFVLACYSPVMEGLFFKQQQSQDNVRKSESWLTSFGKSSLISKYSGSEESDEKIAADASASAATGDENNRNGGDTLVVDCCNSVTLKAAVYHCFSGELPEGFDIDSPNETVARNLAQLDQFAYMYRLAALGELTYRAARKLINKRPVLACAIFDELSYREGRGGYSGGMALDSIKRYALDTMREMPMDTLLMGGVQWMKEDAVESIMQDQDLDVDEFYMFKILKAWGSVDDAERQAATRRMAAHIELKYIEIELLKTQVRDSGYFEEKQIMEAVKLIEDSEASREDYEMERVLIEGAGKDIVNGIYVRVLDEVGMSEEEILFVKEADDGYSDVGLYLWKTKWNIAMCADYSNCFYSCEDDRQTKLGNELVPRGPWQTDYGGVDPPPTATYLPITRAGRASFQNTTSVTVVAPNLEEMIDPTIAEKRRSGYFDRRTHDTAEKRTMTLEQMMNLPIDQGGSTHS